MTKKAFTLTELLVVVVIIGVLAAVVLPKFSHIIEARRTTEAENIMRAVRSEQEARCSLDRNYTANAEKLAVIPQDQGTNYRYALQASGMSATRADDTYTLHMAYRDGRICCQGEGCNALSKYDTCTAEYLAQANNASDECAASGVHGPVPPPPPVGCDLPYDREEECEEGYDGHKYYVRNDECTGYILKEDTCHCVPPDNKPLTYTEDCTSGSGTITYTWNTTTCNYDKSGSCNTSECSAGQDEKVSFIDCSTEKWRRCKNGKWEEYNKDVTSTDCRQGCGKPGDEDRACPEGTTGTQTRTYTCNEANGSWVAGEWTGECEEEYPDPNECQEHVVPLESGSDDTCDGNKLEAYICPGNLSEKKECLDVYTEDLGGGTNVAPDYGNCPYACNKRCTRAHSHCICVVNTPVTYPYQYHEECSYTEGNQTGVGTGGGSQVTHSGMAGYYYRQVTCCPH